MKHITIIFIISCLLLGAAGQRRKEKVDIPVLVQDSSQVMTLMPPVDSVPNVIPNLLSPSLFIPTSRLAGIIPWMWAPFVRPSAHILTVSGFDGSIGFGEYTLQHPDKFFSTLEGANSIDIPELYVTNQKMIGNTLRLAKNFYMLSGILYGSQMGVMGNNWGMGTREGFIWHPSPILSFTIWNQYFQSISVYSPAVYPRPDRSSAEEKMPATPEVFSFGVQASFVAGEFIIGIGTSVTTSPFDPKKSRYK